MSKFYTGIGSRETPDDILEEMTVLAHIMRENGYILRSGGADGADTAFENGAEDLKEIYLPWDKFNDRVSGNGIVMGNNKKARALVKTVITEDHWANLSSGAIKLHTRNACQILGPELNVPSEFVICWTVDGKLKGGTSTAIHIAMANKIPVYNLAKTKFPIDKFL